MKYFARKEFACQCGCGFDTVDYELAKVLDNLRDYFKAPVVINSGCRCKSHNKEIGGSEHSQHCLGKASDVKVYGVDADTVYDYLNLTYLNKYGIGRYQGRTHIDVRPVKARWDNR